jgi:ABC-type multidrug transport system fused ATPase/permease subunit
MESTIFKFIIRYSKRQQLYLLGVIVLSYPFLYLSLDMPKLIVNRAIGDVTQAPPEFYEIPLFGFPAITVEMEQISFLLLLSTIYLALVFVNGGLKYYINVYKGRMGERLLRRLRYQLYQRILRFPLSQFRKISQGELIPMITAEVEPLGGFIGTAFADPLFQGGQLLIILSFIMIQDPILGVAAIALYPFQIYAIPKLQRGVNRLGKQRVQNVRRLSDHLGESVSGVAEIHANDAATRELSRFSSRLGTIYWIRYDIYRRKFFIKFLNNFIDKLTPFFFFSIGGWLVIEGHLSFGALVAVLAAYKDLASPWKELLTWYQQKEDVRIKYEQVTEQFDPPGMLEDTRLLDDPPAEDINGGIAVQNVSIIDDDGFRPLDGATLEVPAGTHMALLGFGNSGKDELTMALAGLAEPMSGTISLGGHDMYKLPHAVTGRHIGYAGQNAFIQAGTVWEALTYGLRFRPLAPASYDDDEMKNRTAEEAEATAAGNMALDFNADWIDYAAAGAASSDELHQRAVAVLHAVDLSDDIYRFGLRGVVDPAENSDVAGKVLEARIAMRQRLDDPSLAATVEQFDAAHYNTNATVAENLLFGVPLGTALNDDGIAEHPYMKRVLESVGLTGDFLKIGERVAETMVELFVDLPPGHEFFDQFSFISAEELPEFQAILGRAARGLDGLVESDRQKLMALTFKMIPARHRLGLIDDPIRERLIEARRAFAADLPEDLKGEIAFFDNAAYTPGATIQDNILFGKLVYGQANAVSRVGALITELLDEMGLRDTIMLVGLDAKTGSGGSRLSSAQRQKVAIARALLKRPGILIVHDAIVALDAASQARILENVLSARKDQTVIWTASDPAIAEKFEQVAVMEGGRVVEVGSYQELSGKPAGKLAEMLQD